MKFQNLSIKWQFVLIIFMVALPFIILSVYNLRSEKAKEIEQARIVAINTARSIGIQQKYTETSTRQLLSFLSRIPEIQKEKTDSTLLNKILQRFLAENPQFAAFLAALPNGNIYAAALPYKPFSITDRKYYNDILRTRRFTVGEFAISRITNKQVIHYAYPVLNKEDSIKFILIASYDLSQYQSILSVSNLSPESDFAFYDFAGRVLYHSISHLRYSGKRGNPEIQKAIQLGSSDGSYLTEGEDGNERLCSFIRINNENQNPYMYIVVSTPISKAFQFATRNFYINISLILLAILVSVLISVYYKNFIFRNFDKLVFTADKLESGELNVRTGIDYSAGETGSLAQALDNMAIALQKREVERDIALSELKTVSERFGIATGAARVGIWEWDLITQKVFWDKLMFELYQIKEVNFKATVPYWMKNLHPEDTVRFEEELHHAIRQKKSHRTSFRILDKSHGIKNLRCYFNVITDKNGKPIRVVGVNWDITERIMLEQELTKAKEKAEATIAQIRENVEQTTAFLRQRVTYFKSEMEAHNGDKALLKEQNWMVEISEALDGLLKGGNQLS
jgi:PAS domain-containing protein